ncbi:hypothetical protein L7F22_066459 [Adiantum nelumboides]|nr:hypothetical protein [Adiantum nelumboides]
MQKSVIRLVMPCFYDGGREVTSLCREDNAEYQAAASVSVYGLETISEEPDKYVYAISSSGSSSSSTDQEHSLPQQISRIRRGRGMYKVRIRAPFSAMVLSYVRLMNGLAVANLVELAPGA